MSISLSDMAVDIFFSLLMIRVIIGVLIGFGVDVLTEVNTKSLSGLKTACFHISETLKKFS